MSAQQPSFAEALPKASHITLGISAKFPDSQAGRGFQGSASAKLAAKVERHTLSRMAQSILFDRQLSAAEQKRVVWCHRTVVSGTGEVGVHRVADGSNARLSGVSTCGSVWHCPVCAAKITEARREELQSAMVAHVANGGGAYLLTLTFPHEADHPIAELMENFAKALDRFKASAPFKRILGKDGSARRLGSVRSLEVTVSVEKGWHPHTHDLVFCNRLGLGELDFMDQIRVDEEGDLASPLIDQLKGQWVKCLLRVGLGDASKITDMHKHGLNVRGGEFAAEYIAKFGRDERWGASSELTRPHAKIGAAGEFGGHLHFTPFQLLLWAAKGDGWAIHRFREYADAFQGKRMLRWSPGLKKALLGNDDEVSDEDLAAAPLPAEEPRGWLSDEQFRVLLSRNKVGEFIKYVAEACLLPETAQADVDDYIESIKALPATHSGTHRKRRLFGSGFAVADRRPG